MNEIPILPPDLKLCGPDDIEMTHYTCKNIETGEIEWHKIGDKPDVIIFNEPCYWAKPI